MSDVVVDGRTTRWCYIDGYIYPPGEALDDREGFIVPMRDREDLDDLMALLLKLKSLFVNPPDAETKSGNDPG